MQLFAGKTYRIPGGGRSSEIVTCPSSGIWTTHATQLKVVSVPHDTHGARHCEINDFEKVSTSTGQFERKDKTAMVFNQDGEEIPSMIAYWFAWYAFHPDTDIFGSEE